MGVKVEQYSVSDLQFKITNAFVSCACWALVTGYRRKGLCEWLDPDSQSLCVQPFLWNSPLLYYIMLEMKQA